MFLCIAPIECNSFRQNIVMFNWKSFAAFLHSLLLFIFYNFYVRLHFKRSTYAMHIFAKFDLYLDQRIWSSEWVKSMYLFTCLLCVYRYACIGIRHNPMLLYVRCLCENWKYLWKIVFERLTSVLFAVCKYGFKSIHHITDQPTFLHNLSLSLSFSLHSLFSLYIFSIFIHIIHNYLQP